MNKTVSGRGRGRGGDKVKVYPIRFEKGIYDKFIKRCRDLDINPAQILRDCALWIAEGDEKLIREFQSTIKLLGGDRYGG